MQRDNPNKNIFGRIDAYLPLNTRLVLRHNYAYADNITFSRGAATSATPNFALTSNSYKFSSETNSSVAEFITNLSNGIYNELLFNNSITNDFRTVPVKFPQLTVRGVPRSDGVTTAANLVVGTEAPRRGTRSTSTPWRSRTTSRSRSARTRSRSGRRTCSTVR